MKKQIIPLLRSALIMSAVIPIATAMAQTASVQDVNLDGISDIMITNGEGDDATVFLGKADGTYDQSLSGQQPTIQSEPAKITPTDAKFNNMKVRTLSKEVRALLGAKDERDLVIVVKAKGGSIMYGAPGRGFKKAEKGDSQRYLAEAKKRGTKVEVVNNLSIKTLRASPECGWYEDGFGNTFWYFADTCPHF